MATEFDNYHGAGGAFEAIASGQFSAGDTVTVQGEQRVVGTSGQLIPADNPQAQTLVQAKNEAVAQATKTNPVTKQEVKTVVQGTAGQAVGTDSAAATAAIQPGNTSNVFTQESINVIPDNTAYLNRDISQDFTESGTLAVGAEVKIEEKNGKFYLKDAQDRYLSNATVLGSTGRRNNRNYVFNSLDDANYYLNFRGYMTPEEKMQSLQTVQQTINTTPVEEQPTSDTNTDNEVDTTINIEDTQPIAESPTTNFQEVTTGGGTVDNVGVSAEDAQGDFVTSGGGFTSVIPSTEVVDLPAGETPVVNPNVPRTVIQDTTIPTYGPTTTSGTGATSTQPDPTTGTFSSPIQTAGLSAVPGQVTYKTHYAGTQGAVPETLVTIDPVTGQKFTSGYQNVYFVNPLGQRILVTLFNGKPITYVPPGFKMEKPPQQQQQQQQAVAAAEGGMMMSDAELNSKYAVYTRQFGYTGPKTREAIAQFEQARPEVASKGLAIGGYIRKYAQGGVVPNQANIAGQPHRLAYVNPQEEKLLAAAGGAGMPSYGGIPAYFTLQADPMNPPPVGSTTTDPSTGTVYTWDGSKYVPNSESGTAGTDTGTTEEQTDSAFDPYNLNTEQIQGMSSNLVAQTFQPVQAPVAQITPDSTQFMPVDAGQTTPIAPFAEVATTGTAELAQMPTAQGPATAGVTSTAEGVRGVTDGMTAATSTGPTQLIDAQEQKTTAVSDINAAQGESVDVTAPDARKVETMDGVSEFVQGTGVDQTKVGEAFGTGEVQAASVQGELASLMAQFEGGNTPPWAAGSMRAASQMLAARGLGASSLAGQAVIQAAMEAALPIAQIDAGNKQQMALFKAEQRAKFLQQDFDQAFQAKVMNAAKVSEIANMNFTAEQQIALENSRAANTMELSNLTNRQAVIMAEAAALSQLELTNLNNRQQAQVENARNFLQIDMANLSNEQATEVFKAQSNINALFTDAAAENAAAQFNATSENQVNQFYDTLKSQTSQFNATQINAMDQFNVNSTNAMRKFNSEMQNQRDQFNAANGLVIAQANAAWRQNLSTLNTAAINQSHADFAKTINGLTAKNLDQIWQRERDIMSYAFTSSESAMDRALQIVLGDKNLEAVRTQLAAEEDAAATSLMFRFLFGTSNKGLLDGIL